MFQRTHLTHWNNFEVLDDLIKLGVDKTRSCIWKRYF